jgi:glutathione S-transferase
MADTYRLITIPPSHFCEKARWALDRYGVPYVEQCHPPILHYLATRRAGGGRTAPVLVTDVGVFADSTDILGFVDGRFAKDGGLYPAENQQRREVMELEELFDTKLGPHTRRVAYFHLLPHRRLLLDSVLHHASGRDSAVFRGSLPLMRLLLRRGMRITPDGATRSLDRVREVFDTVAQRLAEGRRYLVAERFTAADLTFAALASPVLLPRGFGAPLPSLAELPASVLPLIEEMRGTDAGDFAQRLYRDER